MGLNLLIWPCFLLKQSLQKSGSKFSGWFKPTKWGLTKKFIKQKNILQAQFTHIHCKIWSKRSNSGFWNFGADLTFGGLLNKLPQRYGFMKMLWSKTCLNWPKNTMYGSEFVNLTLFLIETVVAKKWLKTLRVI